jgi:transposase
MSRGKQILLLRSQGFSQRKIADMLHVSRNTVARVFQAATEVPIPCDALEDLNEVEIHQRLFSERSQQPELVTPDYEYVHKELLKSGVTLKLLWEEYVDGCRSSQQAPYRYSQYCKLYQDHVDHNHLTMHIKHKPGDKLMVDWTGTTLPLYDRLTGSMCKVYLFVASLPFSMYCYAEATLTMKEEDWINAHIRMYEYLGGSTRLLIPDNLKTAILSNRKLEDPISNRAYQELADYYRSALLPARTLSPRDKAAVESNVGKVTTHIIAKLRNRQFFHINEMNVAIRKELDQFNANDFQKREGNRSSVFIEEELPFMQPLPAFPYEFAQWKSAIVQLNYHIAIDYQNYSVPYQYVKKSVDVRYTRNMDEIFYKGSRISSHKRLIGKRGQYSTVVDHMPPNHQLYGEWDADRFLRWADKIGISTKTVVEKIFESYRVEEQAYKGCLLLLKLVDQYTPERLENACKIALLRIPNPRYKNIRLILEAGQDRKFAEVKAEASTTDARQYAVVRGSAYYGGESNEK